MSGRGRLVLVATPIGNLADLSPRASDELRAADVIVCEDTRRTGRLLELAGIERRQRFVVANEHTEASAAAEVGRLLADGATVAVVTDAGTPGVSDPGERLVRAAIAGGHEVSVVPGPSAALAALVVSGLPTDRFVMEGFLPRSGSARRERLAELGRERRTVVLYEAPHRLARTLTDLVAALGADRPAVVARELTKRHEEVWRGRLGEAVERFALEPARGEVVLVVGGAPQPAGADDAEVLTALRLRLGAGTSTRDAVAEVAAALGVPRRRVYDLALELERPGAGHPR